MGLGAGWRTKWVEIGADKVEIFVSPEGKWYKRCEKDEEPDLQFGPLTYTNTTLRLVCIEHWKPEEDDEQASDDGGGEPEAAETSSVPADPAKE